MDFGLITQTYDQAIFYDRALNKYKGEEGEVFCDMCDKCPIEQSYSSENIDVCIKCYERVVNNINIWLHHLKYGDKELDNILKQCIEKGCDLQLNENKITVFAHNNENKHLVTEYKRQCKKQKNTKVKVKEEKDNQVDMWFRPKYDQSIDNPLTMGENTRLTQNKEDDMKDDGNDAELADFKDHMNTRRATFVPDDSYA